MAQKLRDFVMSRFALRLVTVILFFFLMFPALKSTMDGFVKLVLVWGGVQLIYDLLTKRTMFRARNVLWLILFLVAQLVTVVLNAQTGLKNNLSLLCYSAVAMLVLYPNEKEKDSGRLQRELWVIGWVFVLLCSAASVISIGTFLFDVSGVVYYENLVYYTGLVSGRLWGVFSNPNFPGVLLAMAIAIVQFPLVKKNTAGKRARRLQYAVLGLCLFFNYWYMALAQSRGSLLSLFLFLFIYILIFFHSKLHRHIQSQAVSLPLSAGLSAVAVAAAALCIPLLVTGSEALYIVVHQAAEGEEIHVDIGLEQQDGWLSGDAVIGRDEPSDNGDILSGRRQLYVNGWKRFVDRPLFGQGNVGSVKGLFLSGKRVVPNFHNLIIHSLAAGGLAGTLFLLMFLILTAGAVVLEIWRKRGSSWEAQAVPAGLMALMALFTANNMVEVYIVYSVSLPNFLFFIYLGYTVSILLRERPVSHTDRWLQRLTDRSGAAKE